MTPSEVETMLRRARCRKVGIAAAFLMTIGVGLIVIGIGLSDIQAGSGAFSIVFGGVTFSYGITITLALFRNRHAQRFLERVGGGPENSEVWNEPWYDDVTPYQSLSFERAFIGFSEGDRE